VDAFQATSNRPLQDFFNSIGQLTPPVDSAPIFAVEIANAASQNLPLVWSNA